MHNALTPLLFGEMICFFMCLGSIIPPKKEKKHQHGGIKYTHTTSHRSITRPRPVRLFRNIFDYNVEA